MFQYHSQISEIKKEIENGKIGKVHSYHARFGFPRRDKNDFRYNKELGGGALLDAGGYVIKLATKLLGEDITLELSLIHIFTGIQILTPLGKEKFVVYSVTFGAILDLIVNYICIPRLGAAGASLGTLIAEFSVLRCV